MKKIVLGLFVAATFVIYSVHQRQEASSRPPVVAGTTAAPSPTPTPTSIYKDGQYTGTAADAYYGYIQVAITISSGKLTDVRFLQYPSDRQTSVQINSQAMPYLQQEAIKAQSANVDVVSGATDTSQAFIESLSSALDSAKS